MIDVRWVKQGWPSRAFYVLKCGDAIFGDELSNDGLHPEVVYVFTDRVSVSRYQILLKPEIFQNPVRIAKMSLNTLWDAYTNLLPSCATLSFVFATIDGKGHLYSKDILFSSLPHPIH